MSEEWTREALTEQMFDDLRRLVAHMDSRLRPVPHLVTIVRGALRAFSEGRHPGSTNGPFTSYDLLALACACLQLAREVTLADPEARQKPQDEELPS